MLKNNQIKILLVEDSNIVCKMEVQTLQDIGYTNVITAGNGKEAILKLQEEEIDLMLSDWNMPVMDGYELLQWVRSREASKDLPFIMATAHGERRQAAKAVQAGVTEFITKPFSGSELESVIHKSLGIKPKVVTQRPHYTPSGKVRISVAHIQITDHLILGVLKDMIMLKPPQHFELETLCMPSWNPVQDAIYQGSVDAAFMLAPMAMDMFGAGADIRLLLLAHKNGSICVRKKINGKQVSHTDYFRGRTLYIPHLLSVHHILSDMYLREIGLNPGLAGNEGVDVFFEVAAPVMMPEFMQKSPRAGGFIVAEPIGTNVISAGNGELLYLSGEFWENHPCCVVVMGNTFIKAYPDAAREFINLLIQAGQFISQNPVVAAQIAVNFLDPGGKIGLSQPVLEKILQTPKGVKTDDLFPSIQDLQTMQEYMVKQMGLGTLIDLEKFVDLSFAEQSKPATQPSVFYGPDTIAADILIRQTDQYKPPQPQTSKRIFEISETPTSISITFSAEMRAVKRVGREFASFLEQFEIIKAWPALEKVLDQLLANAIEHGSKNNIEQTILCELTQIKDQLFKLSIQDQGQGFDWQKIVIANPQSKQKQCGYDLIRSSCEQIEFNAKGNQVTVYLQTLQTTAYDIRDENEWKIITPSGNITAATVNQLKHILVKLAEDKHPSYRFDLIKVEDIDSISLTLFVVFVKMLAKLEVDAQLEIINSNDNLLNLFSMTRLDQYYLIF